MVSCKNMVLFGPPEARSNAKGVLENLPQVHRIDAQNSNTQLKLFLFSPISDMEILGIVAKTGLVGIRIC